MNYRRARRPASSIRILAIAFALAVPLPLAGCGGGPATLPGDGPPPNIVLLALDTVRADHLGCYGNTEVATPNIDALAADGVLFSDARAAAPWTLPSFASAFTGLRPWRHGAVGGGHSALADSIPTLAERFGAAGYATGAAVTVEYMGPDFGVTRGFETLRDLANVPRDRQADRVVAVGTRFAMERRDGPFLLLLHWFDAHAPYLPPPSFAAKYYDGDPRGPGRPILPFLLSPANRVVNRDSGMYDWLEGVTDADYPRRQYMAGVDFVDDRVGRTIANLKEQGLYDDALIVLFADHGEHLGEHDLWYTHADPYVEALHVPLIVKLPGAIGAGRVVEEDVSLLDLTPTLLELTGLETPPGLDGRSLAPQLLGRRGRGRSLLVAERGGDDGDWAKSLADGKWKLILRRADGREKIELYDRRGDPAETRNMAQERQLIVQGLHSRLSELFDPGSPVSAGGRGEAVELDDDARRRLRALGY